MSDLRSIFFKYRSYTPIPFLLVMFFYAESNVYSMAAGALIVIGGELIRLWGVTWAGSETRTTGTVGGTFLIISGPFGFVRNPLYVGNILLYLGFGVFSNALFPYLQLGALVFFAVQYHLIVKGEEGYLRKTFGEDYEDYCKNVPRFFPRFTAWKKETVVQPPQSIKAGLRSERRTLQAIFFVTLTLLIIYSVRKFG
ncbi:MAG: hypothetical protein AMXMBFR48_04290 [Ignavibacteriales bacterium]